RQDDILMNSIAELIHDVEEFIQAAYIGQLAPICDPAEITKALRKHLARPEPADFAEVASIGPDHAKAEELLAESQKFGTGLLAQRSKTGLRRGLKSGNTVAQLFTDQDRQQLAKAFAAMTATAELLGRARIRRRQEMAEKRHATFAE